MAIINLFGASGHAKVIMDIIRAQGDAPGVLFDDSPHCRELHGHPVFRPDERGVVGPLIISVGNNSVRRMIAGRHNVPYARAIHPETIISPSAEIGEGSVVMQGAIIQADVRIGRHCIINTGASIDHECVIGDFAHISPHSTLCGNVHVGEGSWIGAATTIIPGIKIGKNCTIGAGSVVLRDIPDGATAYGNPCKIKNMKPTDNQQLTGGGSVLILTSSAA